jgi:hypothetical protein
MRPGTYDDAGPFRTIHVNETLNRTPGQRCWKWWVYDETNHTVIACGHAPTKTRAIHDATRHRDGHLAVESSST